MQHGKTIPSQIFNMSKALSVQCADVPNKTALIRYAEYLRKMYRSLYILTPL